MDRTLKFNDEFYKDGSYGTQPLYKEQTILKALEGDLNAIQEIIESYQPLIERFSKRPFIDENGNVSYEIEKDVKKDIELTLQIAIQKFDPYKCL